MSHLVDFPGHASAAIERVDHSLAKLHSWDETGLHACAASEAQAGQWPG